MRGNKEKKKTLIPISEKINRIRNTTIGQNYIHRKL